MKFNTKVLHAHIEPDASTGAIMTPIFQTSTFVQDAPGEHKGFEYARTQNPTRIILENNLAALENGNWGCCFGSGMAATDSLMKLLNPGDEVIASSDLYGGAYRLFTKITARYGVNFHFVDMRDVSNVEEKLTDKTAMIWIETPTNPLLNIVDIAAVCGLTKGKNIITVVDNTFRITLSSKPS